MICVQDRCEQGRTRCPTPSACGFHMNTEDGGEALGYESAMPFQPSPPSTRQERDWQAMALWVGVSVAGGFIVAVSVWPS